MRGKRRLLGTAAGFGLAFGAAAHHSPAATFDASREIRIEGTLVAFRFENPHASIEVLAPGADGESIRWGIEWGGAGQLSFQGVSAGTLSSGDHVIITGHPARDPGLHQLRMQSLRRLADGYGWGFDGEIFD